MRLSLLTHVLALTAAAAAAQSHDPGPVVLLGGQANASLVPELAHAPRTSLLLVAAEATSPVPLDARAWGGDASTEIVHLRPARVAEVDRALLERVRTAELVAFGPGSPREWLDAMLDRERSSAMLTAVHEAWSGGATLVGRGETAALLSSAFAVDGPEELDWDVRNPRAEPGARPAQGLGYQPWAVLDTEQRSSASLSRLVRVVCRGGMDLALYLPSGAAMVVDVAGARLQVHGEGTVVLIDARRARRNRGNVEGARLTRLPPGAAWDAGERRVPLDAAPDPEQGPYPSAQVRVAVKDVYGPDLGTLPPGGVPRRRWILDDGRRQLELRYDAASRWGRLPGDPEHPSKRPCWVEGLSCDLSPEGS